jgi:hypothetical protein
MGEILDSNAYPGSNILDKAAPANASPSLSGGWDFTVAYLRALARLTVVLVPEYLVVVFIVGALRGWLFPFDGGVAVSGLVAGAMLAALGG